MLDRYCEDVEVVATASNVTDAIFILQNISCDIVFLDIMMPDGTGFDILEKIPNREFEVVFVTAYNDLEVKALKYSAIRFIQKPISKEALVKVIEKIRSMLGIKQDYTEKYNFLFENLKNVLPSRLGIPSAGEFKFLVIDDILLFEGNEKSVKVYMTNGDVYDSYESIDNLEDILSDRNFYRFSHSMLINLYNIESFEGNSEIKLKGGLSFKLQSSRIAEFKITYGNPPYVSK